MKPVISILHVLVVALIGLAAACGKGGGSKPVTETTTRGSIRIAVDETYRLLADSEVNTFEGLYQYADITPIYVPEDSVLSLFLADSVRLMITSRKLTSNEEAYLKDKLIVPRTTHIAWDALAFIVNRNNPDTLIRYNMLRDIFMGKVRSWKDINSQSKLGNLQVVFDNQGSSNVRMIVKQFGLNDRLPETCLAASTNEEVIDFVENNRAAIGVISVSWISDKDDSITHAFLNRVRVVSVTPMEYSEGNDFYRPHPAYIANRSYPFIREVYAISRETFSGLGSGFIQFMAYDQGQRIVLKLGMLPATMPIRLIQIEKE